MLPLHRCNRSEHTLWLRPHVLHAQGTVEIWMRRKTYSPAVKLTIGRWFWNFFFGGIVTKTRSHPFFRKLSKPMQFFRLVHAVNVAEAVCAKCVWWKQSRGIVHIWWPQMQYLHYFATRYEWMHFSPVTYCQQHLVWLRMPGERRCERGGSANKWGKKSRWWCLALLRLVAPVDHFLCIALFGWSIIFIRKASGS